MHTRTHKHRQTDTNRTKQTQFLKIITEHSSRQCGFYSGTVPGIVNNTEQDVSLMTTGVKLTRRWLLDFVGHCNHEQWQWY